MKARILLFWLATVMVARATSEFPPGEPLWPAGTVPGALGTKPEDVPTLTPFWPDRKKATGAAVIVFAGGGWRVLAPHEGEVYARWLNDLGIAAFVLKYRLYPAGYHQQEIIQDAARAVRTVRARAAEWKLDPQRIGVMGSSAGGHLAAVLSTQFDAGKPDSADSIERVSSRPDATILCYALILFAETRSNDPQRREQALGKDAPPGAELRFDPPRNVRPETPPAFIWQTVEDSTVPAQNALAYANALQAAGVRFDLHLYEQGRHGIGLGAKQYTAQTPLHPWARNCQNWLRERGFVK